MTIAEWTRRCPFRASTRNGHRRVPSVGAHYGRHWGLTNHARDDVLMNQCKYKISDNLEKVPKLKSEMSLIFYRGGQCWHTWKYRTNIFYQFDLHPENMLRITLVYSLQIIVYFAFSLVHQYIVSCVIGQSSILLIMTPAEGTRRCPFRAEAQNGHRRVHSAMVTCISDNLETVPKHHRLRCLEH